MKILIIDYNHREKSNTSKSNYFTKLIKENYLAQKELQNSEIEFLTPD